jgi:hypothetical protein
LITADLFVVGADGFCLLDVPPGGCDRDIAIHFACAATHFGELDLFDAMSDQGWLPPQPE